MSRFDDIKTEIDTDPLGRGYSGLGSQAVADDINTQYRTRVLSNMSGDQVFQQTDATEWSALTADDKNLWMSFCGRDAIDPGASANVQFVSDLFGNPSATRTNLINARTESISRGVELGVGTVTYSDVEDARV